jgi:hypothetical protein
MEYKNQFKMVNGQTLQIERQYNNLNRREVSPVNAWVISAEDIPEGAEILIGHNAVHETFKITNHGLISGDAIADKIDYYAIPEDNAFFWRVGQGEWTPIKGYATGLRVFLPYTGPLVGIEPKLIKDHLYITCGHLKGWVVKTLRACDYEIVYNEANLRETRLIRLRHFENPDDEKDREDEIVCLRNDYTALLKNGKLFVGLTSIDAKPLKELSHA